MQTSPSAPLQVPVAVLFSCSWTCAIEQINQPQQSSQDEDALLAQNMRMRMQDTYPSDLYASILIPAGIEISACLCLDHSANREG